VYFDPTSVNPSYAGEYYDDVYSSSAATLVPVTSGATTVDIDAQVGPLRAGMLRVTTAPALGARILVDGVPMDDWGLDWVTIAEGPHQVCFSDMVGYGTPPCQDVVVNEGQTTTVVGQFQQLGLLKVEVSPAGLPSTISVDGMPSNEYGLFAFWEPGPHQVCWGAVANRATPACQNVNVVAGSQTTVVGTFASSPGAPGPPAGFGFLRVTSNPAVSTRISVDGVPRNDWGLDWVKFPTGPHEVCFTDVSGFSAPECSDVNVSAGATSTVNGVFAQLGLLKVQVSPAGLPTNVVINNANRDQFGTFAWMEPNTYFVCWTAVVGFTTPACQFAEVTPGNLTTVTGTFTT
jgi:hypothetical protein